MKPKASTAYHVFHARLLRWMIMLTSISLLSACAGLVEPSSNERLAMAEALFAERCKAAGVKIYRKVENVDGIYLLKLRPRENFGDQFALSDPYGRDMTGDGYIGSFLRGHYAANVSGTPLPGAPASPVGYLYVEVIDPNDGLRYRYTGGLQEVERVSSRLIGKSGKKFKAISYELTKKLSDNPAPRYGVIYDDISTREDREHWIAGSSLRVIDMHKNNEVMAERVGYMIDPGQGNTSGGRLPWLAALNHACPSFLTNPNRLAGPAAAATIYQTDRFVEKVLQPQVKAKD